LQSGDFLLAGLLVEALPLIFPALAPASQPFLARVGLALVGAEAFGFHAETGLIAPDERAVGDISFLFSHGYKLRLR
ncbi:MAG: hypothetical protein M0R02_13695, partial [Bacteroidales bacterium]|nr:hypothetical protein [Bacteroidales bacterium]